MRQNACQAKKGLRPQQMCDNDVALATMEPTMNDTVRRVTRAVRLSDDTEPVLFKALREAAAKQERSLTNLARLYIKRGLREDGYDVDNAA